MASEGGWLNNPGSHGLGEILYEFTSCAANNGSGFEGLGDNTWFWNFSCGIVLILSRFIPIIGQVALAFVILVGTALADYLYVHAPTFVASEGGWLNNPGSHGLGEILYEFTSCAANNGSGFEGLGDNTWFWNFSCGIVLILSRFIPIIGQVALAGLLAQKRYIPESAGTLITDTVTFAVMTFAVIFIVAALSFFPAQALTTLTEHFSL